MCGASGIVGLGAPNSGQMTHTKESHEMNTDETVGQYVHETDPDTFEAIVERIGSRSMRKVGAYVREVDPVGYVGAGMSAREAT